MKKKEAVENEENIAIQKKKELKEENGHSDETEYVEGEKVSAL